MALELVQHGDGRVDLERLTCFVTAFQSVAPLTLGELWALPSMLKLVLLENLRILMGGILAERAERRLADEALHQLESGGPQAGDLQSRLPQPLSFAYVTQLRQRMYEFGPRVAPLAAAVEQALAAAGSTPEEAVRGENERQATDQVSTGIR